MLKTLDMKNLYIIGAIVLCSCGTENESKGNKKDAADIDTSKVIIASELNGCYQMNIGKDTAHLQLAMEPAYVKGTLSYSRYEKDSNSGTIEGTLKDDKLRLWYRFQSEGNISVRQVCFKVIGNKLAEGYGEMDMRHDTAYFKYPTTLRYEENHPYIKVTCN
jgi:hypothetical protein